jgi:hypothetical protein
MTRGGDIWPGAFPAKPARKRTMDWYNKLPDDQKALYYTEFYRVCESRWEQQTQLLIKAEVKGESA